MQPGRASGGAEGLKGDSGDEADELDGFGSGRLGGTICAEGDLELGSEDMELGLTSDDLEDLVDLDLSSDDLWTWMGPMYLSSSSSTHTKSSATQLLTSEVRLWVGLQSVTYYTTHIPSTDHLRAGVPPLVKSIVENTK